MQLFWDVAAALRTRIVELTGAQMLGNAPNPLLNVLPAHAQCLAITSQASENDVHVRVLCIVVFDGNPLEVRLKIRCHALHEIAR